MIETHCTPRRPNEKISINDVRIGFVEIGSMISRDEEGSIRIQDIICMLADREERRRNRSRKTRYPEPLPMSAPARLLSIEARDYLGDMTRRNLRTSTIKANRRTLGLLQLVCGDIPVSRIDHKHVYRLWDLLRWLPKGATSKPKYQALSADELIACGRKLLVNPPAEETLALHHRSLSAFFTVLVDSNAISHSPMAAMRLTKPDLISEPEKAKRLFNDADLQRIFDHKTFVPWASKYPHRWWAPLIGLYTGARISEVAQMKIADVVNHDGMWCFEIRKTVDDDLADNKRMRSRQSIKSKSAIRTIPIMQPLLDAGLLSFLADVKASGAKRLFPHLSSGGSRATDENNSRYSQGLTNQFATYLRRLGFPTQIGFHAFRHALATDLNNQRVHEEDIALITGHVIMRSVHSLPNYCHLDPVLSRQKQSAALKLYKPPVQLPVYTSGQFAKQLSDKSKFYP